MCDIPSNSENHRLKSRPGNSPRIFMADCDVKLENNVLTN